MIPETVERGDEEVKDLVPRDYIEDGLYGHKMLFTSKTVADVYRATHYSLSMLNCVKF